MCAVSTATCVIHSTLQKQSVADFVQLTGNFTVVKSFSLERIIDRARNHCNVVESVAGAIAVIGIIGRIKAVTTRQCVAATVTLRIRPREKMRRINRQVKLKVNFLAAKLIREQSLEFTAACFVCDNERVAGRFKYATFLFVRAISFWSKLFNRRDAVSGVEVGTVEKPHSPINFVLRLVIKSVPVENVVH